MNVTSNSTDLEKIISKIRKIQISHNFLVATYERLYNDIITKRININDHDTETVRILSQEVNSELKDLKEQLSKTKKMLNPEEVLDIKKLIQETVTRIITHNEACYKWLGSHIHNIEKKLETLHQFIIPEHEYMLMREKYFEALSQIEILTAFLPDKMREIFCLRYDHLGFGKMGYSDIDLRLGLRKGTTVKKMKPILIFLRNIATEKKINIENLPSCTLKFDLTGSW
jgi:hypothetical protein